MADSHLSAICFHEGKRLMKKFFKTALVLTIILAITACAKTEEPSGEITDPFGESLSSQQSEAGNNETSESDERSQARDALYVYNHGGCDVDINQGEPLNYNGEPVKAEITIYTHQGNYVNWSTGLSVFINGLIQDVSADGVNYGNMAIYTDLEPGKEYHREIWFKPSVLPSDKGKENLEVSFAQCFNPSYKLNEAFLAFGLTHSFNAYRAVLEMTISKEITDVAADEEIETTFRKELWKNPGRGGSGLVSKADSKSSCYYLNEDGTLSGTYELINTDSVKHRLAFFVNDEPVTFNGGKLFCDIEFEKGYVYYLDYKLDEKPNHFDYIYVLDFYDVPKTNSKGESYVMTRLGVHTPEIIVRHDFIDKAVYEYNKEHPEMSPENWKD